VYIGFVQAALITDQVSSGGISGGYAGPAVQTFTPQQANVTRVDAFLAGTGALTSNVTLNVWGPASLRIGTAVVSATLLDVPRNTGMEFLFSPVNVAPNATYFLEFVVSDALTLGAVIPGQYLGGAVIEGGGNLFNGGADLQFTTYASTVPIPAAVWPVAIQDTHVCQHEILLLPAERAPYDKCSGYCCREKVFRTGNAR